MDNWDTDIETILENIRLNCSSLSKYHKKQYYYYKNMLKYFKIPIIILGSIVSVISIGLSNYIQQSIVNIIVSILSMLTAIIGSIELYLGIQKTMENELESSKQYMILSYDIYKTTNLKRENRQVGALQFLEEKYNDYKKITESSTMINLRIKDSLNPVPINIENNINSSKSMHSFFLKTPNNSPENSLSSNEV